MPITRLNNNSITSITALPFSVGITEVDAWRLTTTFSGNLDPITNWERVDNAEFGRLGTGMTESSGTFSFPSTGIWRVEASFTLDENGSGNYEEVNGKIKATLNNSTYNTLAYIIGHYSQTNDTLTVTGSALVDVTDISNVKVRFGVSGNPANNRIIGNTSQNQTWVQFMRLGDT